MVRIKQVFQFFIFFILSMFFVKKTKENTKKILVVKIDAIGDYILFRNFLKVLREKYKNYHITLVGNMIWKDLSLYLDKDYIDEYIWIDRKKFIKDFKYIFNKFKEISKNDYDIVINPIYQRNFYSDFIVKVSSAKEKIGSISDLNNQSWQKKIGDRFYTKLLPAKKEIIFEFYRNKEFFENLFEEKIEIKKPFIKLEPKNLDFNLPKNYAILFIGASAKFRKWNVKNFAKVGEFLKNNYGYEIVLCGAPSDKKDAEYFEKYADFEYIDLVGKTSLVNLLYVIKNGNVLVSNETSAPHFAVALNTTYIFVISNGNHFGRFTPYPKEITNNYYPIYPLEIENNINDYQQLVNKYGLKSDLDINTIDVKYVIEKIKIYIHEQKI